MGTYLFFASGPRPNDRASRPRTIPIAAQLRNPSRSFVQSGFYEVALAPAIRATLCHATSQNPPDSLESEAVILCSRDGSSGEISNAADRTTGDWRTGSVPLASGSDHRSAAHVDEPGARAAGA